MKTPPKILVAFVCAILFSVALTYAVTSWILLDKVETTFEVKNVNANGQIIMIYYWIEGMPQWAVLWSCGNSSFYPNRPAMLNEEVHLAVACVNKSPVNLTGHVELTLTSPSGRIYEPAAVFGQDKVGEPAGGWTVQFAPVTVNETGVWSLKVCLEAT